MLYGEKYIGFHKLATIRRLILLKDSASQIEAIKLTYSMAETGRDRAMTMDEKLISLNLPNLPGPTASNLFSDNDATPSFLFLLGLLIGDGTIFVRFRLANNKEGSPIWVIALLILPQLDTDSNQNLFNKLSILLDSLGVTYTTTSTIIKTSGLSKGEDEELGEPRMKVLTIEGIDNFIKKIVPNFN